MPSCSFTFLLVLSSLFISIYIQLITLLRFHFMNTLSKALLFCSHKAAYTFLSPTLLNTGTLFAFRLQS